MGCDRPSTSVELSIAQVFRWLCSFRKEGIGQLLRMTLGSPAQDVNECFLAHAVIFQQTDSQTGWGSGRRRARVLVTRTPRSSEGANRVPCRTGETGPRQASSRLRHLRIVARATFTSSIAKGALIHRRLPPPNGR